MEIISEFLPNLFWSRMIAVESILASLALGSMAVVLKVRLKKARRELLRY